MPEEAPHELHAILLLHRDDARFDRCKHSAIVSVDSCDVSDRMQGSVAALDA